jgi:aerobic-type carbon monoxide dehydrogenase small subunit (CoxS/CutS family)
MTLVPFLREYPEPDDELIRDALSAHLCRCTGYANIVAAVHLAASRGRGGEGREVEGESRGHPVSPNQ